jgi:hypothetical protein
MNFLNKRRLEVRVVRNDKPSDATDTTKEIPTDTAQIIRETTTTIAAAVILGIAVYMGADTARQVIVKVTPYAKLPQGY